MLYKILSASAKTPCKEETSALLTLEVIDATTTVPSDRSMPLSIRRVESVSQHQETSWNPSRYWRKQSSDSIGSVLTFLKTSIGNFYMKDSVIRANLPYLPAMEKAGLASHKYWVHEDLAKLKNEGCGMRPVDTTN